MVPGGVDTCVVIPEPSKDIRIRRDLSNYIFLDATGVFPLGFRYRRRGVNEASAIQFDKML